MNRTKIEYLDYTWNPLVGCDGLGCAVAKVCWARGQAKRKKHECELCYAFTPHVHWERIDQPLKVKKPSRIGTVFMGDFYCTQFSENVRASIKIRMEKAYWHTFIVFTKQPQNIDLEEPIPKNMWLCVSVNTNNDVWRIDALRQTEAIVKGISFEPLYEDLGKLDLKGIEWVIIGGQTRPTLLPMPQWIDSIVKQAKAMQIPIFFKNNLPLGYPNKIGEEFPKVDGGV